MADFHHHLLNYGKEVGLPDLKFNEHGVCSLTFNGKINVNIVYRPEQDQCYFSATVGEIPADHREEFFKQLLIANAFGIENSGAILGIEEEENHVILSYTFIASIFSFDLFKTVLENFVTMAGNWQKKCETLVSLSATEASSENSPTPTFAYQRI